MFVELLELLRSGAIRRHPLGALKNPPRHTYTGGII